MEKPFMRRFAKNIFITANCLIAVFFLAGAYVKYFIPSGWWYFGLFTLVLAYLLLALVLFLIFWIFKRSFFFLISLITIICGWHAVVNIFPLNFSSPFSMKKNPGRSLDLKSVEFKNQRDKLQNRNDR